MNWKSIVLSADIIIAAALTGVAQAFPQTASFDQYAIQGLAVLAVALGGHSMLTAKGAS